MRKHTLLYTNKYTVHITQTPGSGSLEDAHTLWHLQSAPQLQLMGANQAATYRSH